MGEGTRSVVAWLLGVGLGGLLRSCEQVRLANDSARVFTVLMIDVMISAAFHQCKVVTKLP